MYDMIRSVMCNFSPGGSNAVFQDKAVSNNCSKNDVSFITSTLLYTHLHNIYNMWLYASLGSSDFYGVGGCPSHRHPCACFARCL